MRKTGGPGDSDEALRVYADLALIPDAHLAGLPADLVARRARCNLLEEFGRDAELGREARALQMDLLAARWPIDHGTFLAYSEQIDRWLGARPPVTAHRNALSDGSAWVWRQWAESDRGTFPATGRCALRFAGVDVTLLWQSSVDRLVSDTLPGPCPHAPAADLAGMGTGYLHRGLRRGHAHSPSAQKD